MAEFTIPSFLENYTEDDVYNSMRNTLPPDIDSSEGSHTWNLLRPTAMVIAEMCEVVLPEVIQLIFPEWSYGEYLDAHASTRGMTRKEATPATGEITITGLAGTVIPVGSTFSTASYNEDDPSMSYATTAAATIPSSGSVTVDVQCTEAGTAGNTNAGTIILVSSELINITGVTNADAISGGTDEETDEALIARIMEYDQTQSDSYVGNAADYRRWAMSVSGVGSASIIPPATDTGIVTIVLIDSNGDPASETLCDSVYDYIMSPDDPYSRLAPINAAVDIVSPTTIAIAVQATVELTGEAVLADVTAAFQQSMAAYMSQAMSDSEVKITKVAAILSATDGVNDFADLEIGEISGGTATYGTTNISLTATELPTIAESDITFTEGTVG